MHDRLVPPEPTTSMVYAAVSQGLSRYCDWTATPEPNHGLLPILGAPYATWRLEFDAFSVKSMHYDITG
jgi:hypothetical protein